MTEPGIESAPATSPQPWRDGEGAAPITTRVIVYHHTHWDREWWATFQDFRFKLVQTVDALIDALESDAEFTCFVLDGQNIVLRDYLEVRPENLGRLVDLIRAGRVHVGPWYVLADSFLTSGEAAIRNLWLGETVAAALGVENTAVGYLPDQFGHVGQMPQILAGFGIENAVVWRGFGNRDDDPHRIDADFWWLAPNGARVRGLYLAREYYRSHYRQNASTPDHVERFREFLDSMREYAPAGVVLEPYGGDHLPVDRRLPGLVAEVGRALREEGVEYRIGSLADYFAEARKATLEPSTAWTGEGRAFGRRAHLLPGVYSARLYLKRANALAQTALERYAEPLQALNWMLGGRYEANYLWLAWEQLLQNHPHDSICGCSIDQVHREMEPRFDHARQIAGLLAQNAADQLVQRLDLPALDEGEERITAFNPMAFSRTEPVTAYTDPALGLDPRQWRLVDSEGADVPFQVRPWTGVRPGAERGEWAEITFVGRDLPGLGYRTYRLRRREAALRREHRTDTVQGLVARDKGDRETSGLSVAPGRLENERLRVDVSSRDGSLSILDKATGFEYTGLNRLADGGDAGDSYNYSWPVGDQVLTSENVLPRLRWVETGPARATLRVTYEWSLPEALTDDRQSRSSRYVLFTVHTDVSLAAGAARVEVRTHFDNTARDHRLQALFPLGAQIDCSSAESVFHVVDRPVDIPGADRGRAEPAVPEHPQASFASISDGRRGLTIANRGLPEFSASRDGVLALTLVRAVGFLSRDDLLTRVGGAGPSLPTPEAQCPGEQVSEYAIVPHAGDWDQARAHREAHAFNAPPQAIPHRPHSPPAPRPLPSVRAELPADACLLEVDGEVEVTTIKKAENGDELVVRLLNQSPRPAKVRVRPLRRPAAARLVDLRERPLADGTLSISATGSIETTAPPWQLVTVAFDVAS